MSSGRGSPELREQEEEGRHLRAPGKCIPPQPPFFLMIAITELGGRLAAEMLQAEVIVRSH